MRVPFQLRRGESRPAAALLVPGDVEAVLRACARLGRAAWPAIHAVAGGFLVRLQAASEEPFPGAIRLRALAANLFVPADADLSPALLEDEAKALVQRRGLVFLPGGQVLAFAPEAALGPADLLALPRLPRRAWAPFPEPPARPGELHEVVLDLPDPPLSVLFEKASGDIGADAVEPPAVGPAREATGRAKALVGQGLFWLGSKLNWKRLASLGAEIVRRALEQAPRISESILGKQESALRELLRQFKTGQAEDALRRALPIGQQAGRGATPVQDARLPTHGLAYRLADFLGLPRGPAGLWLGGGSVVEELEREYRKAAEEAIRRGDFLRAAVIYGKLLQDWMRMATMLSRAGLHHDAALVYLEKFDDKIQAAREFEAAGEFDRALELYRLRGDHLAAGDLLRRIGEAERAVEEYLRAAEKEAARGHHTAAARLLLTRAGRPDLAEKFLLAGWERRPGAESVGCLHELHELYVQRKDRARLLKLIDEAEGYFAEPGEDHAAGKFASGLAEVADANVFPDLSDDLRDRALVLLARKLGQRGAEGDCGGAVSLLFGGRPWEPALVRDAEVAVRGLGSAAEKRRAGRRQRTHQGEATAACAAWETGDLFLGFADGTFVHVRACSGEAIPYRANADAIWGLSCNADGTFAVLLRREEKGNFAMSAHRADLPLGVFIAYNSPCGRDQTPLLSNVAEAAGEKFLAVWNGESLEYRTWQALTPVRSIDTDLDVRAVVVLGQQNPLTARTSTVVFANHGFACLKNNDAPEGLTRMPWIEAAPHWPGLSSLAWRHVEWTLLEVMGVSADRELCWASLRLFAESRVETSCRTKEPTRFLAGTILASGLVAGVHRGGVSWYRPGRDRLRPVAQTQGDFADAVACFGCPPTSELLVVCRQGDVVRVPEPG
jgi:tetratricopeptide (TPR) repeat protein